MRALRSLIAASILIGSVGAGLAQGSGQPSTVFFTDKGNIAFPILPPGTGSESALVGMRFGGVTTINGLNGATPPSLIITGGTSSTSANAGGAARLHGGTGGATGAGGPATVRGGPGGSTSGAGGQATITGGAGSAGNANGGSVVITGGAANGSGIAGIILERGVRMISQGAPASQDTAATLTAAQILTGIITSAPAGAINLQLPLATAVDTALPDSAAGDAFDFSIINTSTTAGNTDTITTNTGWTLVGNVIVPGLTAGPGTSGRFRIRKTGAGAWVLYRL